jgi:hypothetical protein
MQTPNPAKAPWYFLGLQELLHYFPPVVGGVLIPTMVVLALIVIPYFGINIANEPLWARNRRKPPPGHSVGRNGGLLNLPCIFRRLCRAGSHRADRRADAFLCRQRALPWALSPVAIDQAALFLDHVLVLV